MLLLILHRYRTRLAHPTRPAPGPTGLLLAATAAALTLGLAILAAGPDHRREGPAEQAAGLLRQGRSSEALEAVDKALAAEPRSSILHALRGEALIRLDRLVEARESLEIARQGRRIGTPDGVLLSLGFSLDRLGRPAEALEMARALLEEDPENLAALALASRSLMSLGQTDRALFHARRGAQLAPEDGVVQANLARIQARAGELEPARASLERARKLGYPLADSLEASLPGLAGTPVPGSDRTGQPPRRPDDLGLGLSPPPPDAPGGEIQNGLQLKIWSERPRYHLDQVMNVWIVLANRTGEPYQPSYFYESELTLVDDRGKTLRLSPMNPVQGIPAYGLSLGIFGDLEDLLPGPGRYALHWTLGPLESNTILLIVDP